MDNNLLQLAESGNAEAQYKVGMAYYNGDGVLQDYKTALSWLAKSVEGNYPAAFGIVGDCFMMGKGVQQDPKQAANFYHFGAEKGDTYSKYRIGWTYWNIGDYEEGNKYLKEASDGGNAKAMCLLGKSYYNGKGVPEDKRMALQLYEESADLGDAEGQYMVAVCHAFGWGTPINMEKAYKYCLLSANQGHKDAQKNLNMFEAGKNDPQAWEQLNNHNSGTTNATTSAPLNSAPAASTATPAPAASGKKKGSWGVAVLWLLLFFPVGIWYIATHEM